MKLGLEKHRTSKYCRFPMASKFDISKFTTDTARPLPIIMLLDSSGSMAGDKIESLNQAVRKMLNTLAREESRISEFLVTIVTFGGTAQIVVPPTAASKISFVDIAANGGTPLGDAITIAKKLIEDKDLTPSRAFRPVLILVSDGIPTDSWEEKLDDLISNGRSSKCDRMSMGIGPEASEGHGRSVLERFVSGTNHELFTADQATDIQTFFKLVTMSTVARHQSANPDIVPPDADLDVRKTAPERNRDVFW